MVCVEYILYYNFDQKHVSIVGLLNILLKIAPNLDLCKTMARNNITKVVTLWLSNSHRKESKSKQNGLSTSIEELLKVLNTLLQSQEKYMSPNSQKGF